MKTSEKGVAFIAAAEGIVTKAYRDSAGIWTIGVGHTAAAGVPIPKAGMTITRDEALAILSRDLPRYETRVDRALNSNGAANVFDGGTSFDFNTGAITRASWVKAYNRHDKGAARSGLGQWVKAGGRTIQGLVNRRKAEAKLIFDNDYGPAAAALLAGGFRSEIAPSVGDGLAKPQGHYDEALAALGYSGPDRVLSFQKSQSELVNDGIMGPATRAAIDRELSEHALLKAKGG